MKTKNELIMNISTKTGKKKIRKIKQKEINYLDCSHKQITMFAL